jgi:hypothetical protein
LAQQVPPDEFPDELPFWAVLESVCLVQRDFFAPDLEFTVNFCLNVSTTVLNASFQLGLSLSFVGLHSPFEQEFENELPPMVFQLSGNRGIFHLVVLVLPLDSPLLEPLEVPAENLTAWQTLQVLDVPSPATPDAWSLMFSDNSRSRISVKIDSTLVFGFWTNESRTVSNESSWIATNKRARSVSGCIVSELCLVFP